MPRGGTTVKKLVIVLLILVIAAGAWIVNDEVNERFAALKDKHRAEVVAIEKTLSRVEQERDDARQQRDSERDELQSTIRRLRTSESRLREVNDNYLDARSDIQGLQAAYRDLQSASGGLAQIRAEVSSLETQRYLLNEEISVLKRQQASLLGQRADRFSGPRTSRSSLRCTGSMEPTLTCLDTITLLRHFYPEEIEVGHIISYGPPCGDSTSNRNTLHRVIDIRYQLGMYYFRTQGDNAPTPDDCWVPSKNVRGYVLDVHHNVAPENAELRGLVNAANAAFNEAVDDYYSLWDQYCARSDESCNNYSYAVYQRLLVLADEWDRAYEHWRCWVDSASAMQYEGHIPWRC